MAQLSTRRPALLWPVLGAVAGAATLSACGADQGPTGITLTIASVQILNQGLSVDRFVVTTQAAGELPKESVVALEGRQPRGSETLNLSFAPRHGGSAVAIGVGAHLGEQLVAEGHTEVRLRRGRMVSAEVLLRSCLAAAGPFCDGDTLVTCDPVSDLTVRTPCAHGCNAGAARCNACPPSTVACLEDRFVLCGPDGLAESEEDCTQVGGPCQAGRCTLGGCVLTAADDQTPCDDGRFCTEGTVCTAGVCGGGTPRGCDDENDCTFDTCDEVAGACVFDALPYDGRGCDDGAFCTLGETCLDGICAGGESNLCADGNSCTEDRCNAAAGLCENPTKADGTACEDGSFCTAGDRCQGGACVPGIANPCFDANPCTDNSCDEEADACSFPCTAAGTLCDPAGNTEVTCDGACHPAVEICPFGCNAALTACNACVPGTVSCRADLSLLCNARVECDAAGAISAISCCASNRCTCDGSACLEDLCASAPSISASTTLSGDTCTADDNIPEDCLPGGAACQPRALGGGPEQLFRLLLDDGQPTAGFFHVTLDTTGAPFDSALRLSTVCGNETLQVPTASVCGAAAPTPDRACSEGPGAEVMSLCGLPEGHYFGAVDSAAGTCGAYGLVATISPASLDVIAESGNISRGGVFTGDTCALTDQYRFYASTKTISGDCSTDTPDCVEGIDGGGYATSMCANCSVDAANDCTLAASSTDSLCTHSGRGGKDAVFFLALPVDSGVDLSTAGSRFDTVLYLREADPSGGMGRERTVCNDDCWTVDGPSHIQTSLPAGLYFVVVDGAGAACGEYTLTVVISPSATCPNLACEPPHEDCRTCPLDCPCPRCGDGTVDAADGEACDDGGDEDGDGCDRRCAVEPGFVCGGAPSVCQRHCGDGVIEPARGEQCDDGNGVAGDGCNAGCAVEAGFFCDAEPSACRRGFRASFCPELIVPDNLTAGVSHTITVPAPSFAVDDVLVDVEIEHTWIGDLRLELRAPDGTTVRLHDQTGAGADDLVGQYDTSLTPAQSLAAFNGRASAGDWRLTVSDRVADVNGLFACWTLTLRAPTACPNAVCEPPLENCGNCADCTCPSCGDGVLQAGQGETCDDGDEEPGDGCDADCIVEPTWSCSGTPSLCVHQLQVTRCPALPIPDAQSSSIPGIASDTITVPAGCTAANVDVDVDIAHLWRGDLIVELRSPNRTVRLHNETDGSEDDILGNYDRTLTPDGPGTMTDFDGRATAGTWTLWISDNERYVDGTLNCWTLNITCQ